MQPLFELAARTPFELASHMLAFSDIASRAQHSPNALDLTDEFAYGVRRCFRSMRMADSILSPSSFPIAIRLSMCSMGLSPPDNRECKAAEPLIIEFTPCVCL